MPSISSLRESFKVFTKNTVSENLILLGQIRINAFVFCTLAAFILFLLFAVPYFPVLIYQFFTPILIGLISIGFSIGISTYLIEMKILKEYKDYGHTN